MKTVCFGKLSRLVVACLWACLFAVSQVVPVAAADEPEQPLRFRRNFVPADRVEEWPVGDVRYDPIKADKFEEMIAALARPTAVSTVRIEDAQFTARYEPLQELLIGSAVFHIAQASEQPSVASFGPTSLAISDASWQIDAEKQTAYLGRGPDGETSLLVKQSAPLHIDWSARGIRELGGAVRFDIQLPPCLVNRLELSLPESISLTSSVGIVRSAEAATNGRRLWQIQLGAHKKLQLRLTDTDADQRDTLNLVQRSITYDFSLRGVDVMAKFRLDVYRRPLDQLTVVLEPGLNLLEARLGGDEIEHTISMDKNEMQRVSLRFPTPLYGQTRSLQIRATCAIQPGQLWTLPRVMTESFIWQKGTVTLLVRDPLVLSDLFTSSAHQSKATSIPETTSGEAITIQCLSPAATIQVQLQEKPSVLDVQAATTIEIGEQEIVGRVVADVTAVGRERFVLKGMLHGNWQREPIISEPPDVMDGVPVFDAEGNLTIRLNRGVGEDKSLRLIFATRRPLPPSKAGLGEDGARILEQDDFRILSIGPEANFHNVIQVRAREPFRIETAGTEDVNILDPEQLAVADAGRLGLDAAALVWLDDPQQNELRVTVVPQAPLFSGHNNVVARISKDALRSEYRIDCDPQASVIGQLRVQFAFQEETDPAWRVAGPEVNVSAVRLPADVGSGETWLLQFSPALNEPFELIAVRAAAIAKLTPLNLVALDGPEQQTGTLTIIGDAGTDPLIENRGLEPIPSEPPVAGSYGNVLASYRYDPQRDVRGAESTEILVGNQADQTERKANVWSARIESRFHADGVGIHRASFFVENRGEADVQLTMPPQSALRSVSVDGENVRPSVSSAPEGLRVALPDGKQYVRLELEFETVATASLWGLFQRMGHPLPKINIPVLRWEAVLHAPSGYVGLLDLDAKDSVDRPHLRKRLFGPLARDVAAQVFDPFQAPSWLPNRTGANVQQARGFAAIMLDRIGSTIAGADERALTWQAVLNTLAAPRPGSDQATGAVFVDGWSLAKAGINPADKIPATRDTKPGSRARELLRNANLALLVQGESVLLTTQPVCSPRSQIEEIIPDVAYYVRPQAGNDQDSPARPEWSEFSVAVPALAWIDTAKTSVYPWHVAAPDGFQATEMRGWETSMQSLATDGKFFYVVHLAAIRTLAWTLFVAVAAGIYWRSPNSFSIRLALFAILTVLALLLPAVLSVVATYSLLGLLAGFIMRWLRGIVQIPQVPDSSKVVGQGVADESATVLKHVRPEVLLWSGILLLWASAAFAQSNDSGPENSTIHRVLIPVGKDQKQVGNTYWIPKSMLDELYRRMRESQSGPSGYLITNASYRGVLRRTAKRQLTIATLTANYAIEAFSENSSVQIALSSSNVIEARLDGQAIEPLWELDQLSVPLGAPGHYQLEVSLRPPLESVGSRMQFEMEIPPVCSSRLELALPGNTTRVQVPTALGQVRQDDVRATLTAELGASRELTVTWPVTNELQVASALDVEQLLWMKIQPGGVAVTAKLKVQPNGSRVRYLSILADPHLRLFPAPGTERGVAQWTAHANSASGGRSAIDLELAQTMSEPFDLELKFWLADTPGVGSVPLPYFDVTAARTVRRWVAVSAEPTQRIETTKIPRNEALEEVDVATELDAWNLGSPKPQLAFRLANADIDWNVPVVTYQTRSIADTTTVVSCGQRRAEVRYSADLDTRAGYVWRLHVKTPDGLSVKDVSLKSDGGERIARWFQHPDKTLTVFFSGPLAGRYQVEVFGSVPLEMSSANVPQFSLDGCEEEQSLFLLYRKPSVDVQIESNKGFEPADPTTLAPQSLRFGRQVGAFRRLEIDGNLVIKIAPNQPVVTAEKVTWLARLEKQWTESVDVRLNVSQGVADSLRFKLPKPWSDAITVEPSMPFEITESAVDDERLLVLRPQAPLAGDVRLRLQGALEFAPGQRVRPPKVAILDVRTVTEHLVLPRRVDRQRVAWDTRWLTEATLPPDETRPPLAAQSLAVYQVDRPDYQAALKTAASDQGVPKIVLADYIIDCSEQGDYLGLASFDVQPAGIAKLQLSFPAAEGSLVSIRVDGVTKSATTSDDGSWPITLNSQYLPQHIEVLYRGEPTPVPGGRVRFLAPSLQNQDQTIETEQTLWAVYAPPSLRRTANGNPPGQTIDFFARERVRFDRLAALPSATTAEEIGQPLTYWYQRWLPRLVASKQRLAAASAASGDADDKLTFDSIETRLDAIQTQLAFRAGVATPASQLFQQTAAAATPAALLARGRTPVCFAAMGSLPSVEVGYLRDQDYDDLRLRVALALLVSVLAIGMVVAWHNWKPLLSLAPFINLFGFLLGLCYWLWLWPSVVGLAIMLIFAIANLRLFWRS